MPRPDSSSATVRVRLFAALRETAGWSERLVPLPACAHPPRTPGMIWAELGLAGHWPGGTLASTALPADLRVAINQEFASADTPLAPGDELAFLPPITGG